MPCGHHRAGPEQQAGDLQLISRAGAGILLPHAENTILGRTVEVGPKNDNVCCFASNDWWQVNGWTAGVEVGVRYRFYKTLYLELTQKSGLRRAARCRYTVVQQTSRSGCPSKVLSMGFHF
ncbi:hypothetical protein [Candidatus Aalborgicola defluviihabitans]|uniref:hypothetical protein n=1 Tax=Candidatus Aalborgicola defluviihabitans TaxID=3386187 RepID=UPI001EC2FACC|nr:hypothetical protein [Burkholderiales bacterium]